VKLNLGCGFNKLGGFINVDKFHACEPDLKVDLEIFPWPFDDSEADEVALIHSLEHLGQETRVFLRIMQELYRVCKPNALIRIHVPHPRHDNFLGDPTHVRVITPPLLSLFSKKNNFHWKNIGASNSPLGIYLDVDFEVKNVTRVLEQKYLVMLQTKQITNEELTVLVNERNNIVTEYHIELSVIK